MDGQRTGMGEGVFDVSIADGIAHLKLNRPDKRNSMNREFWSALPAIVRDIDDNARARVIVISRQAFLGRHGPGGIRRKRARWRPRSKTRTWPARRSAIWC